MIFVDKSSLMIYPSKIEKSDNSEYTVFQLLSKLPDELFTVFYNQEFVSDYLSREKKQYEIDFLVAYHPDNTFMSLLVLEVKGGNISYNAITNDWKQNGRKMGTSPISQVTSNMFSLLSRYTSLLNDVNVSWGVCFADVDVSEKTELPHNLTRSKVFDYGDLQFIEDKLTTFFEETANSVNRPGSAITTFNTLKSELLKGCDLFKPLHREIKDNNIRFLKLTAQQSKIVKAISRNNNFCIQGPAGSGKTLIAYQQALEYKRQGLNVLYVTFNKQIASHLRNLLRQESILSTQEGTLEITNFHFWALRLAEKNPSFIKEKSSDDFFNTYIPNKALEILKNSFEKYDVLIIDEGQDFRSNWLELLNVGLKVDGKFLLFKDENQDIFDAFKGVPHHRDIVNLELSENCRNTKKIISFLNDLISDCNMISMEDSPEGSDVVINSFKSNKEQLFFIDKEIEDLISTHKVIPSDILILTNNIENVSSLRGVTEFGGVKLKSTFDKEFGRNKDFIFQSSINVFKGLESEVVFLIDAQNIISKPKTFYTEASRAKNKLYVSFIR